MDHIFADILQPTTIGFVAGHHMVRTYFNCEQTIQVWSCNQTVLTYTSLERKSRKSI